MWWKRFLDSRTPRVRVDDDRPPPGPGEDPRAKRVVEIADGVVTSRRSRTLDGLDVRRDTDLPLTAFGGWLKRLDPTVLNATGKTVLEHVFPMFAQLAPDRFLARNEQLDALGVPLSDGDKADLFLMRHLRRQGQTIELRRHRRFSGGDGLLPRGCYASVCRDAAGDDGGSLNRELFAYTDPRIPGAVYVGDSTSARLNAALGNAIGVRPGFCAVYVLLIAPSDVRERAVFDAIYDPVLLETGSRGAALSAIAFETRVDWCDIDRVIDLRLPETRRWFFERFRNGDGQFLFKDGGAARDFYDLVPTLMDPMLGGGDVTHAIGSWMRSQGVAGLVFPSARSDTSVTIEDGALVSWHGWNLLDYRTAQDLPATEVTRSESGWPDFRQPGAQLAVASDSRFSGSWRVTGLQGRYDNLRVQIEGAADGAGEPPPPTFVARHPPSGRTALDPSMDVGSAS